MRIFSVIFLVLFLSGCSNLGYYAQSVSGGLGILMNREPISEVLEKPDVTDEVKQKLKAVLKIRSFASESLSLPDNDSYRTYVDLKRPYVVWNVFAAPEFSMDMEEWCFLFVGCVRYRGYFDEQDAKVFGADLQKEGKDVFVAGIAAYSTIGWFDDPVLNTIINRDEIRLAGLIFHELAHQQVFIKGDTAFNEGFAVTVEIEGIKRWLTTNGSNENVAEYEQQKFRRKDFVALVKQARDRLEVLYQQDLPDDQKRQKKADIIESLKAEYQTLKQSWDGYDGYDKWFEHPINNAQIAAVTTYRDYVPAFQALLQQHNNDLSAFYQAVERLGDLPKEQRQQRINALNGSLTVPVLSTQSDS